MASENPSYFPMDGSWLYTLLSGIAVQLLVSWCLCWLNHRQEADAVNQELLSAAELALEQRIVALEEYLATAQQEVAALQDIVGAGNHQFAALQAYITALDADLASPPQQAPSIEGGSATPQDQAAAMKGETLKIGTKGQEGGADTGPRMSG
ncbi:hypothetical protein HOY80DRAFT_965044 [Tuber brumale]|nr:hypothetical protein HOY80DRAFT_965044 [Tuber brumale]